MRVLVACEESQTVCKAFREKGHEAFSCDTQECSGGHPEWHLQCDVFEIINYGWDLMIGHPPCTFLTYAGMQSWYDEGRAMKRIEAAKFFMKLWEAPIERICLENPRGIMTKIFREADQEIHPYFFGERQMKRTQLWLKNLPTLEYHLNDNLFHQQTATNKPEPVLIHVRKKNGQIKKRYFTDGFLDNKIKTGKEKSKTFISIAEAMANQWGTL